MERAEGHAAGISDTSSHSIQFPSLALPPFVKGDNPPARSRPELARPGFDLHEVMGSSATIGKVFGEVERVAPSDFTVVLSGETGVGKELVAHAIHRRSRRASGPFVPVDCGAIPASLIESELFGHEKGAFTGAEHPRAGRFEAASGGTLFLDEITNLPLTVQAKLLRCLQEKQVWRIGGSRCTPVNIRVIAATNQEMGPLVEAGRFRRDLYHRLNEFNIRIPPLRERRDDIVYLAKRFTSLTNKELGKSVRAFSDEAVELLLSYPWPGNVRELRNIIRRAVLVADTCIGPEHLDIAPVNAGTPVPLPVPAEEFDGRLPLREMVRRCVAQVERKILIQVLKHTGWNKAKAARLLQIDYKTILKKALEYNISPSLIGELNYGQA